MTGGRTARRWLGAVGTIAVLAACSSGSTGGTSGPAPTPFPVGTTADAASSTSAATPSPSSAPATSPGAATTTPTGSLAEAQIKLTEVMGLDAPIALTQRPNDPALYIAERAGPIRVVRDGVVDPEPVVDLSALTAPGGERGLLGAAFSPDGRFLYVDYTDLHGDTNVDELAVGTDGTIDASSRRRVLFQPQPYPNHNGGNIVFGPDGYLYIGFGDGGSEGDPQRRSLNLTTWLGKILRIDPRPSGGQPYRVPDDNPFVGQANALPEIWSYGLRNPWRFSFDATTGDLWIADVGQNTIEEVDEAPATGGRDAGKGLNFGWSAFEGTARYNKDQPTTGTVGPVYEYRHTDELGGCAITGGYVYRGQKIPELAGAYLFADYCEAGVRAIPTGVTGPTATLLSSTPGAVISFGEDADRELYVLTLDGPLYRIDPA